MQSVHSVACRYMGSAYCLHRPQLLERSIKLAVTEGCHVSLDLASFEVVRDFRRELLAILEGKHISLCICNEVRSGGCRRSVPAWLFQGPAWQEDGGPLHLKTEACARLPQGCVCLPASGIVGRQPYADLYPSCHTLHSPQRCPKF